MAENKTKATSADVAAFLDSIPDSRKRADAIALSGMMERLSGEAPTLWGPSIVGFGSYHYRYESGREGDAPLIGFSPRANALTLYIADGFSSYGPLLDRLGKCKTGKACLYLKRLADVNQQVLEELIAASLEHMRSSYGAVS